MNNREMAALSILLLLPLSACLNTSQKEDAPSGVFHSITVDIPVGFYSDKSILSDCGFSFGNATFNCNDSSLPEHYLAEKLWFGQGSVLNYAIRLPVPPSSVKELDVAVLLSSESTASSIVLSLNGIAFPEISLRIQDSKRAELTVASDGAYISGKKVSDTGILDVFAGKDGLRIGFEIRSGRAVIERISTAVKYSGEEILQPSISDIILNPNSYNQKNVLLKAKPAGWSCPVSERTQIPLNLSRSATMLHDGTACIYGSGNILAGKILSPELHLINEPGPETIIVAGTVALDKNGVPFLKP